MCWWRIVASMKCYKLRFVLCSVILHVDTRIACYREGMIDWFLGIDGGGTRTRAVLVDSRGRVKGVGSAASANPHNVGLAIAQVRLREAASDAWASAGKDFQLARGAFVGIAGVKSHQEIGAMRTAAEDAGLAAAGDVTVENDLSNALTGGLSGRPGIALIAGTGANCLGRDPQGVSFMCGGWGWLLDDEGSGFGLALAAVKAVTRAADGRGQTTALTPLVLAFFGVSEPNELLSCFYAKPWTPGDVAKFAPVVMRLAAEGDAVAGAILRDGTEALAGLVKETLAALSYSQPPEVTLLGGCARSGFPYQNLLERILLDTCPHIRLVAPEGSPLQGAALNALKSAGIAPLPKILSNEFHL